MPSPALWAISGEETDLKTMLNTPANIHYIMSHLTAFLILLKLLRSVDGLKELSISPSSSTRVVSIHFSGQFPGVLSKFPSTEDQFNFHQSQFFSFSTWSVEKGFAWTFPSFSKWWTSVHFHGSASHQHRQVFSSPHSSLLTPHYPIIRVQIVNLDSFTQNSLPTPYHALWTCENDLARPVLWPVYSNSWLGFSPAFLFFLFLVLTADNITRDDCLRMRVWAAAWGSFW